jgi:hypothetical protein
MEAVSRYARLLLLQRTMSKRAAWLGPWHPVHRQDVGACELPIGTSALSE